MSAALVDDVLRVCREVLPAQRPLALHEPVLGEADERLVSECLRSGWISTAGPFVERFEAALREVTGAGHVIAVINGSAALHAAMICAGVCPGDEVLVPTLTFVATANAVAHCGAVPHFVDASDATLGIDPLALDRHLHETARRVDGRMINRLTGRRIAALVVMHTFGHPVDMDAACDVADRWGLALIEDAAEALGSTYKGRHAGTIGSLGVLSFNGNKVVTTGGGGAVLTGDAQLARRVRHLCTTARVGSGWEFVHDEVGYNYRMPSLNAALGCAQLEQLPALLAAKQALARRYAAAFAQIPGVRFFTPKDAAASNHWLNTLLLDPPNVSLRDAILTALNADGIAARPVWMPMHRLPMYEGCPRMPLHVAHGLAARIVNLPSGPALATGTGALPPPA